MLHQRGKTTILLPLALGARLSFDRLAEVFLIFVVLILVAEIRVRIGHQGTAIRIDWRREITILVLLLLAGGRVPDAVAELDAATEYAKGDRAALLAIGNGLRRAGEKQAALRAMEAAVAAAHGRVVAAELARV